MTALRAAFRRFFRGRAFTRLLEACGIHPRRYWILVDLFETLGARQELAGMGVSDSMRAVAVVWFILSSFISLVMVAMGSAPANYLLLFCTLTIFQLSLILVAEVAESLVNPVDGLVLAHQPVNGATWSGAKLTHLVRVVVYGVTGMNVVPALAGVLLPHTGDYSRLLYPPAHFAIALTVGLIAGLLCCSVFGWLVRLVPVRRLKAAAAVLQAVPMLFFFGLQFLREPAAGLQSWAASLELPAGWRAAGETIPGGFPVLAGTAAAAVATLAVVFGLRALSRDHLIRASNLMQSGMRTRQPRRRRLPLARWVGRLAGGQAARAGYEYLRALVVRDWQFRRSIAMQAPGPIVFLIVMLVAGRELSPFGPGFAWAHFLPHLMGLVVLTVCMFLAYGNDYKGAWSFATVPDAAFRAFARGVCAGLWLVLVLLPHVFWLLVLAWSWGVADATVFIGYSAAVGSLHLGVGLRLITGVPFGRQTAPIRNAMTMGMFMAYALTLAVAIGIQYVLFRSVAAVIVATAVVGAGAWLVTRITLGGFATRMRTNLHPETPGSLFRFAYTE